MTEILPEMDRYLEEDARNLGEYLSKINPNETICFYHRDMGGIAAQAHLNKYFQNTSGTLPQYSSIDYLQEGHTKEIKKKKPKNVILSDFEPHLPYLPILEGVENVFILGHHEVRKEMEEYEKRGMHYFNPNKNLPKFKNYDRGAPIFYLIAKALELKNSTSPLTLYIGLRGYGYLKMAEEYKKKAKLQVEEKPIDLKIEQINLLSSYRSECANEVVDILSKAEKMSDLQKINRRIQTKKLIETRNFEISEAILCSEIRDALQVAYLNTVFEVHKPHINIISEALHDSGIPVMMLVRKVKDKNTGNGSVSVSIRQRSNTKNRPSVGKIIEKVFDDLELGTNCGGHIDSGGFVCDSSDLHKVIDRFEEYILER